jgi:hypothetical protein
MSPSTRSKPASASSPETGDAPSEKAEADKGEKPADKRPSGPLEVVLEVSRQHAAGWTAFGLAFGGLLVWKLGTVGVWVGVLLMVYGAFNAWELIQTFLHPPGTIIVNERQVILPRGLCMPRPITITPGDVTAVYFLRRSVPWNRSAPVLVIEVGDKAMAFPRDWFASEADQRHVVHALLRGGPVDADADPKAPRDKVAIDDTSRTGWIQMGVGFALTAAGLTAFILSEHQVSSGGNYALYVGPIVAGVILLWRGFTRW